MTSTTLSPEAEALAAQIAALRGDYDAALAADQATTAAAIKVEAVCLTEQFFAAGGSREELRAAVRPAAVALPRATTSLGGSVHQKEIVYDRATRDYAMYLDGELVGFARTYHEAEVTLDRLVFELVSGQALVRQPTAERLAAVAAQVRP